MDKLKDMFFKINAKLPFSLLRGLFWVAIGVNCLLAYFMIDIFTFKPNFIEMYGLEEAGTVRARVEEQMRRYKPKPPPPPAPPAAMAYEVRLLRQHNPFLIPGFVEYTGIDREEKVTDVAGIDLIGTVYSYTPERRSALIEVNGISVVVLEGKNIRGTQKKVIEIGRSRIMVQEAGLLAAPVELPGEHGLDNLKAALADNRYKTESNWEYSARSGKKPQVSEEEGEEGSEKKAPGKTADAAGAADAAAEEEEEEEEEAPAAESGGGVSGGGVDIGGGE